MKQLDKEIVRLKERDRALRIIAGHCVNREQRKELYNRQMIVHEKLKELEECC